MSVQLFFSGNSISGSGSDVDGSFTIDGDYFPDERRVMLDKRYPELTSHYDGRWDGSLVAGHWSFSVLYVTEEGHFLESDRGPFELWPLEHGEELSLEEQLMAAPDPMQPLVDGR
jgi:hypothetical protein